MRTKMIVLSAFLAAGGTAALAADRRGDDAATGLARELAGLTPGKTSSCLPPYRTLGQTTAYGSEIVYSVSRSLKYVSHTTGGCEGVGRGDILITRQFQSQACSGDIATTVDQSSRFPTGSCALGSFTEYHR